MPNPPRMITHDGRTQSLEQWAREAGIAPSTLRSRLDRLGQPFAVAIASPSQKKFGRRRKETAGPVPCPPLKEHASGQAYCDWYAGGERKFRYFGAWGSEDANREYARFASEWAANGPSVTTLAGGELGVCELVTAYTEFAERHYRKRGRLTSEYHGVRAALAVLNDLYGDELAAEFGPNKLRAVQQAFVRAGKIRKTANEYTWKIIRAFRWAVGRELVKPSLVDALKEVGMLQKGRSNARERPKKKPVAWADVEAVFPHLHAHEGRRAVLEAMIRAHWLIGCRPQDITGMEPQHFADRSREEWTWVADAHKNEHRDKPLVYYVGPAAQAILAPFLADLPDGNKVWVYPARRKNGKRWAINRGEYGKRVKAACLAAGVKPWTPHQLRHSHATRVAKEFGSVEAAAAAIGDSPETAAAHYIHVDPLEAAKRAVARRLG